jgi:hypothetical protein
VATDEATRTRELVEGSGLVVLDVAARALAALTVGAGADSAKDIPDALSRHGVQTFAVDTTPVPLVQGCVAWLVCKVIPESHNFAAVPLAAAWWLTAICLGRKGGKPGLRKPLLPPRGLPDQAASG